MTNPNDDALLQDLLDGRLEPSAADEVRRRIAVEPSLASAWEELRRLREAIRALPAPAVPAGFLEGVRRKFAAGEPAPAAGATASAEAGASPPSVGDGAASPVRGRVFRLRPSSLAAAAAVLVAGFATFLATRPREETAAIESAREEPTERRRDGYETRAGDEVTLAGPRRGGESNLRGTLDAPESKGRSVDASSAAPGDPRVPAPFRQPGGAVAPGLREPSDAPPPPATTAPPEPRLAPAPTSAPPLITAPSPAPATALGGGPVRAPLGSPVGPPAAARGQPPAGGTAPSAKPSGQDEIARKTRVVDPFAWAREGVVEAYVVRASSLDEARARVALLRVGLESHDAGDADRAADAVAGKRAEAGGDSKPPVDDGAAAKAEPPALGAALGWLEPLPSTAEDLRSYRWKAPGAAGEPVVLGSFVVDLDAATRSHLLLRVEPDREAAAGPSRDDDAAKSKGSTGARGGPVRIVVLAEPPPAPAPTPVAK